MPDSKIRILLVEDEPAFAQAVRDILLAVSESHCEIAQAGTFGQAQELLRQQTPDVILLDLSLPDRRGALSYTDLRTLSPTIPIVILTGFDDELAGAEAVRAGAQDYLAKSQFDGRLLYRIIRHAIERKRFESALRHSEEFFRLISENVTDLIAVLDEGGRRIYNSPSYRAVLGDPLKLVGTDSFEEIHPEDRERIKRVFRDSLATGAGQRIEYRFLLKDGSTREVESQGSVVRDEKGRPSKLVVVSRDITERKAATVALRNALADLKQSHDQLKTTQQRLIEAERLEAISTFATGVAHEVRNPLQGLTLSIDYLAAAAPGQDETTAGVLNRMRSALERINDVIAGLTEFAVKREQQAIHEDLNAIVERALKSVEHELRAHPIQLKLELAEHLPALELDATSLRHVIITLLMNSIRAIKDGGVLSLRTAVRDGPLSADANSSASPAGAGSRLVAVEISHQRHESPEATPEPHTGRRSPPSTSTHSKSSDTTATRRAAAHTKTGVGLNILKKIVSSYGGTIEHEKEKSGRVCYSIGFPSKTSSQTLS